MLAPENVQSGESLAKVGGGQERQAGDRQSVLHSQWALCQSKMRQECRGGARLEIGIVTPLYLWAESARFLLVSLALVNGDISDKSSPGWP